MPDSCLKLEEANCAEHCNQFRYRIFMREKNLAANEETLHLS